MPSQIDRWNERYENTDLLWSAEPNRFLPPEVEGLTPGRALDLACGEGRNAIWLAEQGWDVTAVDFSDVAVERGRRIAADRGVAVDFAVADVVGFEPAGAYDLVIVFYLQLPEDERAQVLAAAAGALAPGGTLLFVGHDRDNLTNGHGGPQDPAVLPVASEVAAELGGLDVERGGVVQRDVEVDGTTVTAIDTFVLARRPV